MVKDPRFTNHRTPPSHPESPERISAINKLLDEFETKFSQIKPRAATEDELSSTHSPAYIEDLAGKAEIAFEKGNLISIDPDTIMSAESYETAKLAAGASLEALEALREGVHDSAFVAVRPPGHHALVDRAMGFCLFNNVAIAARSAIKQGFKRVFILDWDVHHGNGTQDIFYQEPRVFFSSLHPHPFWPPGSGFHTEVGKGDGTGFNLNIPMPEGSGDTGYLKTIDNLVVPVCREYNPDLIIVSAGYDAHKDDPIAGQNLTTTGFAMMAQRVADLRDQLDSKVLCLLEGGYNTDALARSVLASIRVLNARGPQELGEVHASQIVADAVTGSEQVTSDIHPGRIDELHEKIKQEHSPYWKCFR